MGSLLPAAGAFGMNAGMHIGHEGVEMHPALGRDGASSKNRSISMDLPRPDIAPEIKPARRGFFPKERKAMGR